MNRRRRLLVLCVVLAGIAVAAACSKKAKTPTAPPENPPACSVSRTSVDFGSLAVGFTSGTQSFAISNSGGGTLTGTVYASCPDFLIASGEGAFSLAGGQSHSVAVQFHPQSTGVKSCVVSAGCSQGVTLNGVGTAPACSVNPTSLAFDTVAVGQSVTKTFSVTNVGSGTLAGTVSEACPDFSLVGSGSYSLAPGQAQTFTVRFSPSAAGAQTCTVGLGSVSCPGLTCTGTGQLQGPVCRFSPSALDFGMVCVYRDLTFTIANAGPGILSGSVSSPCSAFQVIGHSTYNLAAGERDTFTIRFAPTTPGPSQQGCGIVTGCGTYACTGTTISTTSCTSVWPTLLDFGTVYVEQTAVKKYVIHNYCGTEPVYDFNLMRVIWTQGADFHDDTWYSLLKAGESYEYWLYFTPTREGPQTYQAELRQKFVVGDGQYHTFGCFEAIGTGQTVAGTPVCEVSDTLLDFGAVPVGQATDRSLTVTNVGGGVLNGSASPSCDGWCFVPDGDGMYSLGPSQSKTFTIRFRPPQAGHAYTCPIPSETYCPVVMLTGEGR